MKFNQTLILGDLSGLQDFLFDVAAEGGGQARRLRARSLSISLLAECAARRILDSVGWTRREFVFLSAGKFLFAGPHLDENSLVAIKSAVEKITQWLLTETCGGLRLAVTICDSPAETSLVDAFFLAQHMLQKEKLRPWAGCVTETGRWLTERLVLPELSPPCELCRRRPAQQAYNDDGLERKICQRCYNDWRLGRDLPNARWLELHSVSGEKEFNLLGFGVRASAENRPSSEAIKVFPIGSQFTSGDLRIVPYPLARHVPQDKAGRPIEFKELAAHSEGAPLLGILKMDADNLGLAFREVLNNTTDLLPLTQFSKRLDDFFATELENVMKQPPWDLLYVVFSGGDDLLLIGPWNIAFGLAWRVRQEFMRAFSRDSLTLSAGLAVIKPAFPIRNAVEQADALLERAKSERAPAAETAKDQFAAFGQVWKWNDHETVLRAAEQLISWVKNDAAMPRGWLHTFLKLAEDRNRPNAGPVTARLAYHIGRNLASPHTAGPKGELRRWAEAVLEDFDAGVRSETRLLPAILRYALTATRLPTKDES
jgi:CRISPR-associated protein Csm1